MHCIGWARIEVCMEMRLACAGLIGCVESPQTASFLHKVENNETCHQPYMQATLLNCQPHSLSTLRLHKS